MRAQAKARTVALLGEDAVAKLENARVAVVGLGGVGGHVLETLARAGVGSFILIDGDLVDESNLNRQIIATADTVGTPKAEAAKQRVLSINPLADVTAVQARPLSLWIRGAWRPFPPGCACSAPSGPTMRGCAKADGWPTGVVQIGRASWRERG